MSLNTLETAHSNGDVIDASHINEVTLALLGALVGRNGTGVATPYQDLGTAIVPWGNFYARQLIINGSILDPAEITSRANRIISGRTRTTSGKSDFIRANGAALSFTILSTDTDLTLSINDTPVLITADIVVTGVTAAPSVNNTCQVNDLTIPAPFGTATTGGIYIGEDGDYITLDNMGANVSSKIGQIVALKHSYNDGTTTHVEIMYGLLESATRLRNVFRGYFFDSTGTPIARSNFLGNNEILTIMSLGWVFLDVNGTTTEVSYKTPVYASVAPTSPAAADYWYDQSLNKWKRYSGSAWIIVSRLLIGTVVADQTNCIASRSFDFEYKYSDENTIELELGASGTFIVNSKYGINRLSVNAENIEFNTNSISWNLATVLNEVPTPTNPNDLAVGDAYLYIKETGGLYASTVKPYDRRNDLKGFYHPYESWRCVGRAYIGIDYAATELGILQMASAFTFNPNVLAPVSILTFSKANGVAGGSNSGGPENILFNEVDNTYGAVNACVNDGSGWSSVIFGRGEYKLEFEKVAFEVDKHRLHIYDSVNAQLDIIGSTVTAPATIQSTATLNGKVSVRAIQCIPAVVHITQTVNAGDGYGAAYTGGIGEKEVYGRMIITKLR